MSHSSCVRRKALRSAASCLASVVLPAAGNPQVRISRAALTTIHSRTLRFAGARVLPAQHPIAVIEVELRRGEPVAPHGENLRLESWSPGTGFPDCRERPRI